MGIADLKKTWTELGEKDPFWAILTESRKKGNKWTVEDFFATGEKEIDELMGQVRSTGFDVIRGKALDFGCGAGRLTRRLADYFDEVAGVDIAESMVELARSHNQKGDRCRFYLNERDDIKLFADSSFSFIYSSITLQHMEARLARNYIEEFVRVLVPGGLAVFQVTSEPEKKRRSFADTAKRLIAGVIPGPLFRYYLRRRYGHEAVMEMHGIRKEEVVEFLESIGADIVDIIPDRSAAGWLSYRYFFTKAGGH